MERRVSRKPTPSSSTTATESARIDETRKAALTIGYGRAWKDRVVARRERIGTRVKRLRLQRGLSQRDLSSPGISYAYISRIEAGARTPSVKALRRIADKLGVTVEHLETGEPTPLELGVADAGLEFASLTAKELRAIEAEADRAARGGAQRAAEEVLEERREAEVARLRKRSTSSPAKAMNSDRAAMRCFAVEARGPGQRASEFPSKLFQKGCDFEAATRIALPSRSALESAMPRRGHSTNRCSVPDGGSGHSQYALFIVTRPDPAEPPPPPLCISTGPSGSWSGCPQKWWRPASEMFRIDSGGVRPEGSQEEFPRNSFGAGIGKRLDGWPNLMGAASQTVPPVGNPPDPKDSRPKHI